MAQTRTRYRIGRDPACDWPIDHPSVSFRHERFRRLADRSGYQLEDLGSTIATSQLPSGQWHGVIGDATLADAILDRLVHNAYKINLRGESMRKHQAELTNTAASEQEEKPRVATLRWVAALLRSGWQLSGGMGSNLQRFPQLIMMKRSKSMKSVYNLVTALGIILLLAACDGGGGGDPSGGGSVQYSDTVTISGYAIDDPITSGTITIRNSSGTQVATSTTDSEGAYSIAVPEQDVEVGYEIQVAGGQMLGEPFEGSLRAYYDGGHYTDANVTPLTTLVEALAETQTGQTRLARRDAAIALLDNIGMVRSDEWFALEPESVDWESARQMIHPTGLDRWVESVAADLNEDGELSAEMMLGFPRAHGGLIAANFGDNRRARLMKGFEHNEIVGTASYTGEEQFTYELLNPPAGLEVSSDGVVSYTPDMGATTGVIPFQVRITNTATGKGRILEAEIEVMDTEVVAEGVIGPEGGQIADEWEEIVLTLPEGTVAGPGNFQVVRSYDEAGLPVYTVVSDVDMLLPGDLQTPQHVPASSIEPQSTAPVSASRMARAATSPDGWVLRKRYPARFAKLFDGLNKTNRLKNGITGSCPVVTSRTGKKLLDCYWEIYASKLESFCQDENGCDGQTPIMFVHGYSQSGSLGGGEGTWGQFREMLRQEGYAVYEFKWRTNANFRDVAVDLSYAIGVAQSDTGKSVHLIAHSFGGLLARTYLQGQAGYGGTPYRSNVASLITLGTPHSGIFPDSGVYHGESFPDGQDSHFLQGCGQISCNEAGQSTPDAYTIHRATAANVNLSSYYGVGDDDNGPYEAGSLVAEISDLVSNPMPVNTLVLMGLTNITNALTKDANYQNGDGLISFEGQRFLPAIMNSVPFSYGTVDLTGGATYHEVVLGESHRNFVGPNSSAYESVWSLVPLPIPIQGYKLVKSNEEYWNRSNVKGYRHTKKSVYSSFRGSVGEAYVDSADHHAYQEVISWLPLYVSNDNPPLSVNINVSVLDQSTGSPVVGADVYLQTQYQSLSGGHGRTDSNGDVSLTVPFQALTSYQVLVSAQDYRSGTFDNDYVTGVTPGQSSTEFGSVRLTPDVLSVGNLVGQIIDAVTGSPIVGADYELTRNGVTRRGTTDSSGRYAENDLVPGTYVLTLRKNGYVEQRLSDMSVAGDQTTNVSPSMTPVLQEDEGRIRLSWGADPRDLDSHLRRYTNGSQDYHVYYSSMTGADATLDRDDTDGDGPETITINPLSSEKTYRYVVHHFSGSASIATSSAVVSLNIGDSSRSFYPPNESGKYWHVFDIVNGTVLPCQQSCMSSSWPALSSGATASTAARASVLRQEEGPVLVPKH